MNTSSSISGSNIESTKGPHTITSKGNKKYLMEDGRELSFGHDINNVFSSAQDIRFLSDRIVAFYSPSKTGQSFAQKVKNIMVASSMLEFRNSVYLVDLVTRKVLTLTPEGGKTWDCFDMTGRDELTRWTGSGDYFSIHLNRIKDGNFPPMEYWGKGFTDF